MPKVPSYERSVARTTPGIGSAKMPHPIEGAFGGNVARSLQYSGDVGMAIADKIYARAQERDKEIKEKQLLEKDTEFRQNINTILYNDEPDDNGIPKGILNRKLGQAQNATKDFDRRYYDMRKQYVAAFKDPAMQTTMAKMLDQTYFAHRDNVVRHERTQIDADIENGFMNNLDLQVNQAAQLPDGPSVVKAIDNAVVIQKRLNRIKGYDPSTSEAAVQKVIGAMAKSAFSSAEADNNLIKATSIYNAVKDKIPAEIQEKMKEELESGIPYRIAVRDAFLDPVGTREKLKENTYDIKDPVKRKAAYDFTNTLADRAIADSQETRNNTILDGLAQGKLTLTDIENEMQVPEEAGGMKKSMLVNYQKAIQRGIEKDLNRMLTEKDANKDPTARAKSVRDYLDLIDAFTADDTDKWHAREKLSAAYADGIINGQEAQFLNRLKTDLKDIQFNRSSGPMVAAVKAIKNFMHKNNASDEEITINIKRLLGTLKDSQDAPQDVVKKMATDHVLYKIPDAVTFPAEGQLMQDAYGNKAIVMPDGTIKPYVAPKKTPTKPAEKK